MGEATRRDARDFAQCAARHGVAVTPGSAFAADESCVDYLRIPFVLEEAELVAGVERLALAWSQYRMLNSPATPIAPLV